MTPNPLILQTVEQLEYRVTVGDVAANAGLDLNVTRQGLLALATDASGQLQVSDTGEIIFLFPRNFRSLLRNKFWRLRLKEYWEKVWNVLFYLIRISFAIILIASIVLMMITIAIVIITITSSRDNNGNSGRSHSGSSQGGGLIFLPRFWLTPDIFWLFDFDYNSRRRQVAKSAPAEMNFLEAVFSFLFGDGDPNADLEERRWRLIGSVIRHHGGAVAAEQIAPYWDKISPVSWENEDYMLPVLTKFNGYPQVSPEGEIIYYFPELQVRAAQQQAKPKASYLQEYLWQFSRASSGQIILAIGLGAANLILALCLGSLLRGGELAAQIGGLVAFVASIYWLLLGYGAAFLAIPLIRYFWLQNQNHRLESRNQKRQKYISLMQQEDARLLQKLDYARQFAADKVISDSQITYSTETDLLDQELQASDQIDREWQKRLESNQ